MDETSDKSNTTPLDEKINLKGFYLFFILAVLAGVLYGLLKPNIAATPEAARRNRCSFNLRLLGVALRNYEAANGHFPPAYVVDKNGKSIHSWRVLILPEIEKGKFSKDYNFVEPWDGPSNRKMHNVTLSEFRCPTIEFHRNTRQTNSEEPDLNPPEMTNYVAVVGPGTAWPGDKKMKMSDFSDGPENTILLVEVANTDIHWMEPRDLDIRQMSMEINSKTGICSKHPSMAHAFFADGSVRALPNDLDPAMLKALLTPNGGEDVSAFFD